MFGCLVLGVHLPGVLACICGLMLLVLGVCLVFGLLGDAQVVGAWCLFLSVWIYEAW